MKQRTFSIFKPIALLALCYMGLSLGCGKSPTKHNANPDPKPVKKPDTELKDQATSINDVHLVDSAYVPDKQCALCHEEIWNSYQQVGMAQSAYAFDAMPNIEDFENGHFYHEASKKHYEMKVEDGDFVMTRYRVGKDGSRIHEFSRKADFVIGSGHHSRTYCFRDSTGAMFQMPVVWYTQPKKWGMAPGYDNATHDDFSRPITRECMFCHNAYPENVPGTELHIDPDLFAKKLPHGIGCQRCHGPGEAHVKAAEKDPQASEVMTTIINPSKLPDQQRDDVCNQCHLQPTSARTSFLRHFGREAWSFRPGEKLADFQSYVELSDAESRDLFEVNHHAYRMHQSKCFTESNGAMNCVSCHDPHAKIPKEKRAAHYRESCFQCHEKTDCLDVEQGHAPDADCVACHMPLRRSEDAIHVLMTDHKIARPTEKDLLAERREMKLGSDHSMTDYKWLRPEGRADESVHFASRLVMQLIDKDSAAVRPLQNQISTGKADSDEAKAMLAQALLELGNGPEALKLLNELSSKGKQNSSVQSNLAMGLIQQRKFALAIQFLEKAIQIEPVVPESHFNLGIAYINTGRIDEAIEQFRKATELQPNLANARFYLASALARNEQYELAEKEFEKVLQIEPDHPGGAASLADMQRLQGKNDSAIQTLEDETVYRPNDVALVKELALQLVEAVERNQAEPETSLDAAKRLFKLAAEEPDARLIVAASLLQNGYNKKALEAVESINDRQTDAEQKLLAAVANLRMDQKDAAEKLRASGIRKLEKQTLSKTRLQTVILKIVESTFSSGE